MREHEEPLLRTDSRAIVPHCEDFFEGPEKLFEISFKATGTDALGLRSVDRATWEDMLKEVQCTIVSTISNQYLDAYLLSESTLLVFPRRLMIKTCGNTTLLKAVSRVLEIAKTCGLTEVESLFYTRKNFLEPEKQSFPHRNFGDEVKVLDEIFANGTAYVLGKLNGDHLYVYTVENGGSPSCDQNLEILMHDLDEEAAAMFFRGENFTGSRNTTKATGIASLFQVDGLILDDLVFDPCGYSVNGIFDQYYFTIHVTPQSGFSFASFETNAPVKSYTTLVNRVLDIFRPGRYSVSIFANDHAICGDSLKAFEFKSPKGFLRDDKTHYEFQTYNLTYAHYEKLC